MCVGTVCLDLTSHTPQVCVCVCVCVKEAFTVVSHQDDINTAVEPHLLQSVHQLTHNLVNLPQRVV